MRPDRWLQRVGKRAVERLPQGRTRDFARSVTYLFSSDAILAVVGFGVNVWVVRWLGPARFGQLTLVFSVAQLLVIPLIAGLQTAATRYIARESNQAGVIGAVLRLFALLNLVCVVLFSAFAGHLVAWLHTTPRLFAWSVGYAEALSAYYLVRGVLVGLKQFGRVAMSDLASGAVFAAVAALALIAPANAVFAGVVIAHLLRWLVFAGIGASEVWRQSGGPWRPWLRPLVTFASLSCISTVAGFLFLGNIDNLMLNRYLGEKAVGLYGAYYAVFNVFTTRFLRVVLEVLLPTAAAHQSPQALFRKVWRSYLAIGWVIVPVGWALSAVLFVFYGRAYPYDWQLGLLMGVSVCLYGAIGVFSQLLIARSLRAVWLGTAGAFVGAAVNVVGNMLLIPRWHIAGVMLASIVASVVAIMIQVVLLVIVPPEQTGAARSATPQVAWPA